LVGWAVEINNYSVIRLDKSAHRRGSAATSVNPYSRERLPATRGWTWQHPALFCRGRGIVFDCESTYSQISPRVGFQPWNGWDLNPAIALAAVFVGAAIWGPLGALIGIPLAAAGVAILDTYKRRYDIVPEIHTQPGAAPSPPAE
jgi:hypothetical protein